MPSPITYSEIDSCVPLAGDDLGVRIVKAHVIFPQIAAAVMAYMFNEDGTLTDAFKADLVGIDCTAFT